MSEASDVSAFFSGNLRLRPKDIAAQRRTIDSFVEVRSKLQQPIVLITSGGTTVPLELNTVRFIDNFSSGTRGAQCSEEFLEAGYAVVLLHRKGSNFPFLTDTVQRLNTDPVGMLGHSSVPVPDARAATLAESLLAVGFTTIFEYLFLLREACQSLHVIGSDALVFLAAAVSDFYVPESEMASEKIQSRAHDGLTLQLRNVPKLLGCVKDWAPDALVISFKLETNPNILLAKAAGAIDKYNVDAVCSNMLQTYRDVVTIVRKQSEAGSVRIAKTHIDGEETEPVLVEGVDTLCIERGSCARIDEPLVRAVIEMHKPLRKVSK